MKRMFGEYVSARRFPNMVKEIMLKASLYNMFITMKQPITPTLWVGTSYATDQQSMEKKEQCYSCYFEFKKKVGEAL